MTLSNFVFCLLVIRRASRQKGARSRSAWCLRVPANVCTRPCSMTRSNFSFSLSLFFARQFFLFLPIEYRHFASSATLRRAYAQRRTIAVIMFMQTSSLSIFSCVSHLIKFVLRCTLDSPSGRMDGMPPFDFVCRRAWQ